MFLLKRWYFLLPGIVLILLLAIWLLRIQAAEEIITSAMSDAGLTDITLDIDDLNSHQTDVTILKFSLHTDTGLIHFEAQNLIISYLPRQLIDRHIDELIIDRLILDYSKAEEIKSSSTKSPGLPDPAQTISVIQQILRSYIFFNKLQIREAKLIGEPFGVVNNNKLKMLSSYDGRSLDTDITLLPSNDSPHFPGLSQLASKLTADAINVKLGIIGLPENPSGKTVASIEIVMQESSLTANYQFHPDNLKSWLAPLLDHDRVIPYLDGINETADIHGSLFLQFTTGEQQTENYITATLTAASNTLGYQQYKAENAGIRLKLKSTTNNPGQNIQILNGSYIRASNIIYHTLSLQPGTIYLVGELSNATDNWQYKGGMRSDLLTINTGKERIQINTITARMQANAEKLAISGNFSPNDIAGSFEYKLAQDLAKTKAGELTVRSKKPVDLVAGNKKLSQLLTPWPFPFDLLSGSITMTSAATWSQKNEFSLKSRLKLTDTGGYLNELVFSGLSFDHQLKLIPRIESTARSKLSVAHLDSGVGIDHISADILLVATGSNTLPELDIKGLNGQIFGGTFSADDFVFDPNSKKNSLRINASNIDLAEIVRTQQLSDISATGRIDGSLPVEIDENGINIKNGAFINGVRNGIIRYNPPAVSDELQQNPVTGIALDALRDFRYSYLSAGVNFTEDGNLSVNLQLKGTSPELDTRRPVHLNINTEQNLISLLKSLRYAEGLSEDIDKKVRDSYEHRKK